MSESGEQAMVLTLVLDDVTRLEEVLDAWSGAGVKGTTILESTGARRVIERHASRPAYAGLGWLIAGRAAGHCTLFAVVEDVTVAAAAAQATEAVVGDLRGAQTGIMFAAPVARVWGWPKSWSKGGDA